jgi:aspartyl-tRNA(Asn)/glutamyl-tRNA(Gln) amidotransferase subunit C
MPGPPIDRDAVARLAELAQLDLDEAGLSRVTVELAAIVAYAAELASVDVEGVTPMQRPWDDGGGADDQDGLRDDDPRDELPREVVLREAPRTADGGFEVPPFVDEG